jgi:hypothetical protein
MDGAPEQRWRPNVCRGEFVRPTHDDETVMNGAPGTRTRALVFERSVDFEVVT